MEDPAQRHWSYLVNGQEVLFPDRVITGREALTKSGHLPASEYQLILVRNGRTHLIETDDDIDLAVQVGGALRAFHSDRSFSFTVDEVGQIWGTEDMEVDEFLKIWATNPDHEWVLERVDELPTLLAPGGVLSFGPEGVEHVVSRKVEHTEKVRVTVVTTAGTYPAEGFKRYPASTPITQVLADAKRRLDIKDTDNWIVTVGGKNINIEFTLAQAGFTGEVALEWGLPEGGGGA